MMWKRMIIFVAAFVLLPWNLAHAVDHTKDTPADVQARLKEKKAVLLDVREQKEWDEGHIQGAVLLPLSKIEAGAELKEAIKDLKKDTIIYCHCRAGKRALSAAEKLMKQGYDVRPLKPGYEDLLKAGFEKASPEKASPAEKSGK